MGKWFVTKEPRYMEKWDDFVLANRSGSFLQTLDRVKSYERYGFEWELILKIDDEDEIIGGSLNILAKFSFVKMYICSYGPTYQSELVGHSYQEQFITEFNNRAKNIGACVAQITLPKGFHINPNFCSKKGKVFSSIPSIQDYNLINLIGDSGGRLDSEALINSFSKKARRDVRASYRKGLQVKVANTEAEMQEAYACFEDNAGNKGYSVRSWEEFSEAIISMCHKERAYLLSAWYNDNIQGAILIERSSDKLHYTMGGVHRHSPDLNTGYFLQMEAMMMASRKNCQSYDVSCGGPIPVKKFKESFNPTFTEVGDTFYFVHRPVVFKLYQVVTNHMGEYIFPALRYLKAKLAK